MDENQVGLLFKACDVDGSGYIDKEELSGICSELSSDDLQNVFKELDVDGDGRISLSEFAKGFKEISESRIEDKRKKRRERLKSIDVLKDDVSEGYSDTILDDGLKALSCQEKVIELYQKLHSAEYVGLVPQFENIIYDIVRDVKQYSHDNSRLETSLNQLKTRHDKNMQNVEEEMENEVRKVEMKIREEERAKAESDYNALRAKFDNEFSILQLNLKRLQQEPSGTKSKDFDEQAILWRVKLDEMTAEKRQVHNDLTDAHTNVALLRSEMAQIRQQYEQKSSEVELERKTVVEYIKEQDNLTRQLHLLQDANKTLHDTNDDLRESIDSSSRASIQKRPLTLESFERQLSPRISPRLSRESSIAGDFNSRHSTTSSLADELSFHPRAHSPVVDSHTYQRHMMLKSESCDDSVIEDLDSGHSTMRELNEVDTDSDDQIREDRYRRRRKRQQQQRPQVPALRDLPDMEEVDLDDHDHRRRVHAEYSPESGIMMDDGRRMGSSASRESRGSQRSIASLGSDASGRSIKKQPSKDFANIPLSISKEPERIFKVILAGDAAVGKSSFIMRLCKGKFQSNLSSTLGVDFHTKVLEVDGRMVALQLWDTAGQERFRSIAKSYFRRADGVLLLYDCTYERSFLSVRQWVETVEDGAQKKVPIMMCANKTDIRDDMKQCNNNKTISEDEGSRLAREFDALFIETSAKDGSNIEESVMELARLLRTNQDLEVKSVGLQLHDTPSNKKTSGCC